LETLLERASRAKIFHGLYFWGEGVSTNAWWRPGGYVGLGAIHPTRVDLLLYTTTSLEYKGALGIVFACGSDSGKTTLNSGTPGSIWHGFQGVLIPFPRLFFVANFIRHGDQGTH